MPDLDSIQKRINDKTEAIRAKYGIPNLGGVLVRSNGNHIVHSVSGIRDASKSASNENNKMGKHDYFNVGSVSKPISGLLIARLIKKGVLGWNTRISDVFTEFKSKDFRDHCGMNDRFINKKVFELIAHTSGLGGKYYYTSVNSDGLQQYYDDTDPFRNYPDHIRNGGNPRDDEFKNFASVMHQRYLYAVLCMKQKRRYNYNSVANNGYDNKALHGYSSSLTICVAMVERLLNKRWEQVMNELLANSLSGFDIKFGPFPNGEQAHYYDKAKNKFVPNPAWNNDMAPYNSKFMVGGINCTVGGIAQFIKYNLPAYDYSNVFDISEYQKPVTSFTQGGLIISGGTLSHSGESNESLAHMEVNPGGGYGLAVMTNCNRGNDDKWKPLNELKDELRYVNTNWFGFR